MNAPPSDGSESSIDIFVLSKNQTEVPARMAPLEQAGYRITVFDDPPALVESLHEGKPNLLICDTISFPEAYDLCRHVKDDSDLWVIPVLILTDASDLTDLLHILDCNADNYLASPYNSDYFLSIVEGMLSTPVERQTPEQIKTQFKIQHDDRLFVVTADRRKLLEFLLSSFEIAVTKYHDLSRATDEIHVLSDDVKRLEMFIDGQKQTVEELTVSLHRAEQENKNLEQTRLDNARVIVEKTGEIERLTRNLESDKALMSAAEDHLRTLVRDKEESERQSVAEISALQQKVTALSADLAATTAALDESRNAHSLEKAGHAEVRATLEETAQGKELAEKTARSLTIENEQMKISLTSERNRAAAAEQEIKSVLLAKSESEQDLTRVINDLKETAKQQAADLQRQKAELEEGKTRILNLEIQIGNLKTEKEKAESDLMSETGRLQQDLAGTREKLDATQAVLDEKELELERLTTSYTGVIGERDAIDSEREALVHERLNLHQVLEEKTKEIDRLNGLYNEISGERIRIESEIRDLQEKIQAVQQALDDEKERHGATREDLDAVIRERDAALQSLQGSHQTVQADLAEHRESLAQAREDLASASAGRAMLERDLECMTVKLRDLESQMQSEITGREEAQRQGRSLSDELDEVKAAFENERRLHHTTVESLRAAALDKEGCERDLRDLSGQIATLQSELSSEKEHRIAADAENDDLRRNYESAENRCRSREAELEAMIKSLKEDLTSATLRQDETEEKLQSATREKYQAEEKVTTLAAEIEQARAALADEWEDHMNDHERLTVAVEEKQQLEKSISREEAPEPEKARKRALIIKAPDLPMEIGSVTRALTSLGIHESPSSDDLSETTRISGVEDLFEDDEPSDEPDTPPVVSIIQEPSGETDWEPPEPLQFTSAAYPAYEERCSGDPVTIKPEEEIPAERTGSLVTDEEDVDREESGAEDTEPEDEPEEDPGENVPGSESDEDALSSGIAFNRAQWFDLLKWAHHSGALSPEQRMQIVRMGRLIQKGRRLTRKQDEQVREMIALVQALGYRFT